MGEGTSDAEGVIIGQDDVWGESVHLGEMAAELCVACRRLLAPFISTLDRGQTESFPSPGAKFGTLYNYVWPVLGSPALPHHVQERPHETRSR
jgi:hypothetical protein